MLLMQSVTGGTIEGLVMQLCSTRWTRMLSWPFFFPLSSDPGISDSSALDTLPLLLFPRSRLP